MKKVNTYLIITALLLIILGAVCIVNPVEIFQSMAWLVGVIILLTGVVSLIFGLRAQKYLPNAGSTTLLAAFQIFVGITMLCNNVVSSVAIIVVFAMWVIFEGLSLSILSFDYKRSGYDRWWIMLLFGVCSILLGFLAMRKPEAVQRFMGIMLGFGIFANGIERIVAFSALRRIQHTVRDMRESATAHNIDDIQNED
ncbi:MAG: DUF308 domain-containing protein [Bacteroidales bacterium]|nr:DUF308 domain-containing protein [Bacteroidales bacterium]